MRRGRVTPLDHDEALTVCEKIRAKHPDILERQADGLYRHQLGSGEMRAVLMPVRGAGAGVIVFPVQTGENIPRGATSPVRGTGARRRSRSGRYRAAGTLEALYASAAVLAEQ